MNGAGLFGLRDALRQRGPASAAELARRLQRPEAVVQAMLEHWLRRGRVQRLAPARAEAPDAPHGACSSGACSSCGSCSPTRGHVAALYAWCEHTRLPIQATAPVGHT